VVGIRIAFVAGTAVGAISGWIPAMGADSISLVEGLPNPFALVRWRRRGRGRPVRRLGVARPGRGVGGLRVGQYLSALWAPSARAAVVGVEERGSFGGPESEPGYLSFLPLAPVAGGFVSPPASSMAAFPPSPSAVTRPNPRACVVRIRCERSHGGERGRIR
jgi:hypothetical protein